MLAAVSIRYVIQERESGLFLAENLNWVRSFKLAGRCDDLESAIDTAQMNTSDVCEIHQVVEFQTKGRVG
jgi:hypothetical protein